MKYFAKLLPTEGEIKDGDMYQTEFGERYMYLKYQNYTPEGKLLKLFLCSIDIQVGDKVYEILSDKTLGDEFEWTAEIDKYNRMYIDDCFKVIGEILTAGIKDGQEFTDEEVEYLTIK